MTSSVHPHEEIETPNTDSLKSRPLVKRSLGFIRIDSRIRKIAIHITSPGSPFNTFILVCILMNAVGMAFTDYRYIDENYNPRTDGSITNFLIEKAEILFFSIFIMEFLLKIVAFGFAMGKNTYLRDNWNKMDFIVLALRQVYVADV